jgi:hypothetical protein
LPITVSLGLFFGDTRGCGRQAFRRRGSETFIVHRDEHYRVYLAAEWIAVRFREGSRLQTSTGAKLPRAKLILRSST